MDLEKNINRDIDGLPNPHKSELEETSGSDDSPDRFRKIRAFVEFLEDIRGVPTDEEFLRALLEQFLGIVAGQSITFLPYSYFRSMGGYTPQTVVGEGADIIKSCLFREDEGYIREIMDENKPLILRDIKETCDDVILRELGKTLDFSTAMFTPVEIGKNEKGIICVFAKTDQEPYREMDIKLLQVLAQVVGLILSNLEMRRRLEQQNRELDRKTFDLYTVYQVSKTLSSILDTEELTMLIADMLTEVMTVERVFVMLLDEDESCLKVTAHKFLKPDGIRPVASIKVTEKMTDWLMQYVSGGVIIEDLFDEDFNTAFPEIGKFLDDMGIKIVVPMIHKYKLIGLLALGRKYVGRHFVERDYEFLSTIAPLAANAISNAHLYELAILDGLTRVFLGRYFQQRFKEELKRARRYKQIFSLVMWDIDHFKEVNDTYGHLTGDTVLREISTIFKSNYRQGVDLIGRYGGEEFVMLLPDTPKAGAKIMSERLRKNVEDFDFAKGKVHLTISGGISSFPEDGDKYEELIEQADISLYDAKRAGRNKVCARIKQKDAVG